MIEIEKVAENLFDKIRSRFDTVNIGDENTKSTLDPAKARFFNFDYVVDDRNLGNITISLVDTNNLKVFFDKDIDKDMSDMDKKVWYNFLKSLRLFAKRNMLSFDVRDIAKSGLNLRDLKHANKNAEILDKDDIKVTESKLYGTSRSSYQKLENVRIIVRHSKPIVDENIPGARSRNVESFYIENSLGERYRCPEGTTINGARVYARHVKNGGQLNDDFGRYINKVINEMNALKTFTRNMRGRTFEDMKTSQMVSSAIDHYGKLHRDLHTLQSQRGYEQYKQLWQPELLDEEEIDLNELKERFTRKVFDERLMDALPVVYKAYTNYKNNIGEEFEAWANGILETESNPIDKENIKHAQQHLDIEEQDENSSPLANKLSNPRDNESHFDSDAVDNNLDNLLKDNGFQFKFLNGVYYFESKQEIERAKDIMAAWNPKFKFPRMGVYNYGYGTYGSSTNDREIGGYTAGVMEESDLSLLRQLAGITK